MTTDHSFMASCGIYDARELQQLLIDTIEARGLTGYQVADKYGISKSHTYVALASDVDGNPESVPAIVHVLTAMGFSVQEMYSVEMPQL